MKINYENKTTCRPPRPVTFLIEPASKKDVPLSQAIPDNSMSEEAGSKLYQEIATQGSKIRELKSAKASSEDIKKEVAILNDLKSQYKTTTGQDYAPPSTGGNKAEKAEKKGKDKQAAKEGNKDGKDVKKDKEGKSKGDDKTAVPAVYSPPKEFTFYPSQTSIVDNMKVWSVYSILSTDNRTSNSVGKMVDEFAPMTPAVPRFPCIVDKGGTVIRFGAQAVVMYLLEKANVSINLPLFTLAQQVSIALLYVCFLTTPCGGGGGDNDDGVY